MRFGEVVEREERREWLKEHGWRFEFTTKPKPVKRKMFSDQEFQLMRPQIRREA